MKLGGINDWFYERNRRHFIRLYVVISMSKDTGVCMLATELIIAKKSMIYIYGGILFFLSMAFTVVKLQILEWSNTLQQIDL
jgi:hypothetical protein